MKLNICCSDRLLPGYVNVDIHRPYREETSLIWQFRCADLNKSWPFADDSAEEIVAHDAIEHLADKVHVMNEAWRVLRDGGVLDVVVPTTDGRGAFQDPTHVSYWNRNSFLYYLDGDPHRERFGDAYGVRARFKVVEEAEEELQDKVVKLSIKLRAVKP